MARRGATPPPPTSSLALIANGEARPILPEPGQDLGGTMVERFEAMRPGGVAIDELPLSGATHNLGPEIDPLTPHYTSLTHPVVGTEPFRPFLSRSSMETIAKRVGPQDPRVGIMGRVLDLDVQNFQPGLGSPQGNDERWCLVDPHWVSGQVGMTLDAADAAANGQISPYVPLLMNPQRDTYFVWERDMGTRRYDGRQGEYIFRSAVSSTDPHPEDALAWYFDFGANRPDTSIKTRFLDPLSLADSPERTRQDAALVDKLLGRRGRGQDFELYVSALARATFRNDYDADRDDLPNYVRDEVKRIQPLLDLRDATGPMGLEDFWRTIVPAGLAKMVGRTVQMLDELKTYRQNSRGADLKQLASDEATNRRQIAESFVAAVRYYSIIHKLFTVLPNEYRAQFFKNNYLGQDVPPFEQPLLLDFVVVDDMDRTTLNPGRLAEIIGTRQFPASTAREHTTPAAERVRTRVNDPNGNDQLLIVRSFAPGGLRSYSNLDSTKRGHSTGNAVISNGLNDIPAGSLGAVYPDEILRSLVDPIEEDGPPESQRFPMGGLAMLGVVAMIEVDTRDGKSHAFLVTSAKRQPHGLNRALLGRLHAHDRTPQDIAAMATSGKVGLTALLAAEHRQTWRMVGVKGPRVQDIVAKSPVLENGDTFTIAVDKKGDAGKTSRILGNVTGQGPVTRRVQTLPKSAEQLKPTRTTPANLSHAPAPEGRVADTEIVFANNRVYVRDGRDPSTSGRVSLYPRTIASPAKGKK